MTATTCYVMTEETGPAPTGLTESRATPSTRPEWSQSIGTNIADLAPKESLRKARFARTYWAKDPPIINPGFPRRLRKCGEGRAICWSVSKCRSLKLSLLTASQSHRHQPINGSRACVEQYPGELGITEGSRQAIRLIELRINQNQPLETPNHVLGHFS